MIGRRRPPRRHGPDPWTGLSRTRTADVRDGLVTVMDAAGRVIALINPHTRERTELPLVEASPDG